MFNQLTNILDPLESNFLILDYKWYVYAKWITFFYILCVIIFIGLFLKNNANHVKILNLTSALIFIEYLIFYNQDNFQIITLSQNFTYFAHLFIFIAIIFAIIFFLGISQKNFFKENTKIEFTLLIWCIIIAAEYLISSTDFISIIILIECIAFSSYVLVGFERKNKFSVTAGLQYLILASIPGGLFILGFSLFYNNFGTFSQDYLNLILQSLNSENFQLNSSSQNWDIIMETNYIFLSKIDPESFSIADAIDIAYNYTAPLNNFFEDLNTYWTFIFQYLQMFNPIIVDIYYSQINFFMEKFCEWLTLNFEISVWELSQEEITLIFEIIINENPVTNFIEEASRLIINFGISLDLAFSFILKSDMFGTLEEIMCIINPENADEELMQIWGWLIAFLNLPVLLSTEYSIYTYSDQIFLNITDFMHQNMLWFWCQYLTNFEEWNLMYNYWLTNQITISNFDLIEDIIFIENFNKTFWEVHEESKTYYANLLYNSINNNIAYNLYRYLIIEHEYALNPQNFINDYDWNNNKYVFNVASNIPRYLMHISFYNTIFFDIPKHISQLGGENYSNNYPQEIFNFLDFGIYIFKAWPINYENFYFYKNTYLFLYLALFFIIINISFKLTAAPFHFWAPSIYGGSPLPTLTFLSIFSKTIFIFFSIWLFINIFDSLSNIWQFLLIIIAFLSIFVSILGAFSEKIFKRFFVYSSTGHVGFMLLGIIVLNINGLKGTIDYLILYILSSFIVWFIIMYLTKKTVTLVNLKGLSYNQPYLGLIFSIILFSLSGIPPLGGFFVKYEIFYSLINSSFFLLAYILLILTIISFFYYLRLIKILYFENNKKFYKFKNFDDIKLRIISFSFFTIPFFILFSNNAISIFITNILIKSLF